MNLLEPSLWLLFVATVVAFFIAATRPGFIHTRHGRLVMFAGFFVLPITITGLGTGEHLKQAKTTEFCVSCHVMEPYGKSLLIDDPSAVPAVHFQNSLTPREHACYSCHTNYTMFGDFKAKLNGLQHVWVYYLGTVTETLELYEPYNNRECLSCHGAARSYLENDMHVDMLADFADGSTSCLDCHDLIHDVGGLADYTSWSPNDPLVGQPEGLGEGAGDE